MHEKPMSIRIREINMSIVIAGASGEIGQALYQQLSHQVSEKVYAISRRDIGSSNLRADLSNPADITRVREFLQEIQPSQIFCCTGLLHDQNHMPEKRLSQINDEWILQSFSANLLSHIHLAQALDPILSRDHTLKWLSLSAKVGSMDDNALGGWYSYRISKAALNMFIKNLSIEWTRKSSNILVASVHPGTTYSELSKPFQSNIAPDRLYTPEQTATRLISIMQRLSLVQHGRLLHWDGSVIAY